jgi:hypothetical protein
MKCQSEVVDVKPFDLARLVCRGQEMKTMMV